MLREKESSLKAQEPDEKREKNSYSKAYAYNASVSFYLIDLKLECFASVEMRNWESGRRKSGQRSAAVSWSSADRVRKNKGEKKR